MSTQPTILAAVDLDRHATAIIAQAARLAALCQAHLVVAHVVDDAPSYEADHPFPHRAGDLRDAMVRHARAWLVGMVNHLDLPNDWVEIRVESGAITRTLADLVVALQPRYCLLGPARLGPLSPTAGLAAALGERSDCELMTVTGRRGTHGGAGVGPWIRHWLAGESRVSGRRA